MQDNAYLMAIDLDQQIRQLEQAFLKEGGIRERMTCARLEVRDELGYRHLGDWRDREGYSNIEEGLLADNPAWGPLAYMLEAVLLPQHSVTVSRSGLRCTLRCAGRSGSGRDPRCDGVQ